jgi:cytochrome c biogenesis protein CcmG/thiol:disulfide interchange protein DsbE
VKTIIRRHWNLFSAVILLTCLLWIWITSVFSPVTTQGIIPAPKSGFLAPGFSLTKLDGEVQILEDLRGKTIILNFWTTWCALCETEMPTFQKVVQETQDPTDFVVLAVNSTNQDDPSAVAQFVKNHGLSFPIPLDIGGRVTRLYQVRAFPTTFFIGPDGIIYNISIGGPVTEAMIKTQVRAILEKVH